MYTKPTKGLVSRGPLCLFLSLALASLFACGGDDACPSCVEPPIPEPIGRQASVTVEVSDGVIEASPIPGKLRRASFLVRITESAGVDVEVDYFRLQVWNRVGRTEVDERTASQIISTFGTNTIAGGASVTFRVSFDYNLQDLDSWRLTVGVTDPGGKKLDYVAEGTVSTLRSLVTAKEVKP